MKKKYLAVTTTAVSLGLATVLTISAVAPSFAASHGSTGTSGRGTAAHSAPAITFTSVNFTVTNVPSSYTTAAAAAKQLVLKVVPLADTATSAPATAPVPSMSGKLPAKPGMTGAVPTSPPVGAPTPPKLGTPPTGPKAGSDAKAPKFATPPAAPKSDQKPGAQMPGAGVQFENLVLSNQTLTGTIKIPAGQTAGVEKFAVYPMVAADSANNVAASSGTPVMLTVTTLADGTATVVASGSITVSFN